MNPKVPEDLIAVKDGDHVMGYYALFTVPDAPIPASKLTRAWAANALPMNLVPDSRKPVDTFKNACRSIETRRGTGSNRVTEIKVDQVAEDSMGCIYQVTRMVRDKNNRVIDHPKAFRAVFDKDYDSIEIEPLTKRFDERLQGLADQIESYFNANEDTVPGSKVRQALRGLMDHAGATNVRKRSGGVYFVPKEGKDDLQGIIKVLDFLYGEDAEAHLIPCANDDYQQRMIQKHFELNVSNEIDETISRVADKLTSERKIRHDALGNMIVRRQQLGDLRNKYAEIVGDDLAVVNEKLSLLDKQLTALMEKVGG